MTSRRGFVMIP